MLKNRPQFINQIKRAFRSHPIVAILGPRQCGKTTLSRLFLEQNKNNQDIHSFDLEDPTDLQILANPKTALLPLQGLIIIDEIQRLPNLFRVC